MVNETKAENGGTEAIERPATIDQILFILILLVTNILLPVSLRVKAKSVQ